MSRKVHALNKTAEQKITCGPAQPDSTLTAARQPMRHRAGMPRIKRKRDALPTLNCTTGGFRLRDGRLHLAGGIILTVVWSRGLPSAPSSVRVYRDSLGHWHCSFVVATEAEPLPPTGRAIGIDWGVRETATTTSGTHDLPHAEHGKTAAQKPARHQRQMARRRTPKTRPDTKGYRAHTTMDCARCGARAKHALPLSERTYSCTACGAESPRDRNSAHVMLTRAGLNPASADLVSPVRG
ncbi:zinc ribbon domain-containing protein [Streptomyces sp. NPDC101118]|uniref:zinc ribbon domain-containing protein n=1 Tax=Streptomyces sp. NPDC101118 TaxID=3366109 RepID=UPI003802E020